LQNYNTNVDLFLFAGLHPPPQGFDLVRIFTRYARSTLTGHIPEECGGFSPAFYKIQWARISNRAARWFAAEQNKPIIKKSEKVKIVSRKVYRVEPALGVLS
jgi:hypothetical protein